MVATVHRARTLIRILVSSAYLCALPSFVAFAATEASKAAPSASKTQQPNKVPESDSAPKKQMRGNVVWSWDRPYTPSKEVLELEKRATEGDQRAQAEMSLRYRLGEGTSIDFKKALQLCELNPHPIAKYNLARMIFDGEAIEKDQQSADKLLQEACEPLRLLSDAGDSLATWLIGVYTREGWAGISRDLVETEKLIRKSNEAGCVFGTVALGQLLLNKGDSKRQEAQSLLRLAAQKGSIQALKLLTYETRGKKTWKSGEPTDQTVSDLNLLASLGDMHALDLLRLAVVHEKYRDDTKAFKILEAMKAKMPESEVNKLNHFYAAHYMEGRGTSKNYQLAFKLAYDGAMSGNFDCCITLWRAYGLGHGVPKNYTSSYAWGLVAAGKGRMEGEELKWFETNLPPQQIAEAQKLAESINSKIESQQKQGSSKNNLPEFSSDKSTSSGTGFFVSDNGYIATNFHVVSGAKKISVRTANGEMGAVMVLADQVNDVAVIKAPVLGKPLLIGEVSAVVAGTPVYTVGFPNPVVQGFEPKLTKGDINSTTGLKDDPRMFQISVPVQPGNSGGPLLNERGTVIGIITAQLNSLNALVTSGSLPQNVNYALKTNYLKPLIESNKELREAVDGSKSKDKEPLSPEMALESVLLILVEK